MVVQQVAAQAGLRLKLYRELEPAARGRGGLSGANWAVVGLVLFSFLLFALETEPTIDSRIGRLISTLNLAVLVIFAAEYLVRLWCEGENPRYRGFAGRIRYIFQPYSLADLVAFLPELIWLSVPHPGDDSMLMFLRILRLIRLIKIARFMPAFEVMGAAIRRAGGQLLTALSMALALVFVSAVVLYFIEGVGRGRPEFGSIPRALWWAMATLTTVGYGDIYPITVLGKIAAGTIAFAGIGVVALPTGIFASAFSDELRERDRAKLKALGSIEKELEAIGDKLDDLPKDHPKHKQKAG